jgi:hypothetical protein
MGLPDRGECGLTIDNKRKGTTIRDLVTEKI